MPEISLHAPAIHCEGCASAIKRSLSKLPGVQAVEVAVDARQVGVKFDPPADAQKIKERLAAAGFPTD